MGTRKKSKHMWTARVCQADRQQKGRKTVRDGGAAETLQGGFLSHPRDRRKRRQPRWRGGGERPAGQGRAGQGVTERQGSLWGEGVTCEVWGRARSSPMRGSWQRGSKGGKID